MADRFGATTLPLVASSSPKGRDDFLFYTLAFLKAVANAKAILEWQNIAPPVGSLPVVDTFDHDPRKIVFNDNKLPALFLYRNEVSDHVQEAQDIFLERGSLDLLWVAPPASQETRQTRAQFASKLFKLFSRAVFLGRDPSYVVAGDAYDSASTRGSVLARWAKFRRLRLSRVKPIDLVIPMADGSTPRAYEAYLCVCPYEEEVVPDMSLYDEINAVDLTIQAPADVSIGPDPLVTETALFTYDPD